MILKGKNHPQYKEKIKRVCLICGKRFSIFPYKVKENRGKYCSKKCYWKFRETLVGDKGTHWKGGKYITNAGYIFVYNPTHPFCNGRGYIQEHRLVMEAHIGRHLLPTEVVHHINGIKTDNIIENLELFSSLGKHAKEHQLKRKE